MRAGRWILSVIAVLLFAAVGMLAYAWGSASSLIDDPVEVTTESTTSEIITAVEREEQIVLLSTATQGLHKTETRTTALGWNVPGTARTNFLQYTYTAKLGIEGRDVRITETGDSSFRVSIPEFSFIGYSDPTFDTVLEDGQVLSFVSPEIDTADIITDILNGQQKTEHINRHRDLLRDQARAFYTGIIHAIDDDVQLQFEFR
ncbi:MAG: hypothetical protein Q4G50_01265 [Corynebacterium sp.]|uniref:hypothetical protein n=1 Tax=Corynebacterium sp. TaxID=1720 RepID=UPI0026DEEF08|nr:hypothetical protein [Corynebacterium sp.]MDO5668610.1 hypothetical protein [Corynebacterium sp.]